jgi:hypothetical protein
LLIKQQRQAVGKLIDAWLRAGLLKVMDKPDDHRQQRKYVEVGTWAE